MTEDEILFIIEQNAGLKEYILNDMEKYGTTLIEQLIVYAIHCFSTNY